MSSCEHLGGTHSLDLHKNYPRIEHVVYHWAGFVSGYDDYVDK
jgi:hypothetical protein